MTTREFLPIPPTESATDPIASTADLKQRWRALMGCLGFGERLLRFVFIGPDRCMIKVLSDVPIGPRPDPSLVRELLSALSTILAGADDGTTVALLLTRPGVGAISQTDREWSKLVAETADVLRVPIEPFFRANDEEMALVEPSR
jgi:hypothetical protein